MQANHRFILPALLALGLGLTPVWPVGATEEPPDDEFLEFLGVWDEAWTEACDPDGGLPGDDACLEYDNDEQENVDDERERVDDEN